MITDLKDLQPGRRFRREGVRHNRAQTMLPSYTVLSCTIRELFAAAARLEVDANAILSDMFDLVPKHGASSQLPVRWLREPGRRSVSGLQ